MNIIKNFVDCHTLLNDTSKNTTVIFCSLSFCQPCKVIYPKFEEVSNYGTFKNINFSKINMDQLDNDDDEQQLKNILNLEDKKYPQIVFLQQGQVICQLEYSNFEKEFENMLLLFV